MKQIYFRLLVTVLMILPWVTQVDIFWWLRK